MPPFRAVPLAYGLTAATFAVLVSGPPATTPGLLALVGVFVVSYWGKISSSHSFISRYRTEWSPTARKIARVALINQDADEHSRERQ